MGYEIPCSELSATICRIYQVGVHFSAVKKQYLLHILTLSLKQFDKTSLEKILSCAFSQIHFGHHRNKIISLDILSSFQCEFVAVFVSNS